MPAEDAAAAKASGLDFYAATEHNTTAGQLIGADYAAPGLLVLNGEEVTSRAGHIGAIGQSTGTWFDFRLRPGDGSRERAVDAIHRDHGSLAIANHPEAFGCSACAWRYPDFSRMDAIEVWNSNMNGESEASLKLWDDQLRSGRPTVAATPTGEAKGPARCRPW